jgi:pyruvate/2-oxoglutarate/acetoin dehydrogenase E1 component
VKRVCALPVPIPYSPILEDHVFPNRTKIADAVREVMKSKVVRH